MRFPPFVVSSIRPRLPFAFPGGGRGTACGGWGVHGQSNAPYGHYVHFVEADSISARRDPSVAYVATLPLPSSLSVAKDLQRHHTCSLEDDTAGGRGDSRIARPSISEFTAGAEARAARPRCNLCFPFRLNWLVMFSINNTIFKK